MQYEFLNIFLEEKELLNQTQNNINPFLLENSSSQIQKIYNFFKSDVNFLFIDGYLGSGKAEVVDYTTSFLSDEAIVLKYNCFNSTNLDDILLAFFVKFKKLSSQNVISEPKVKTEDFTQRINSYFSYIEKPFVIIIDSFEAISNENRKEILDFIFHLGTMSKVKIIIIGRAFEEKYFTNIPIERITMPVLEKTIFDKYIKAEKIKTSIGMIDEFYKHTQGYYFFTVLSLKLIKNSDLSLFEFLKKFKSSYAQFDQFLAKQAFRLIPPSERNLFWFLSIIRHPVSIKLLKKLKFYNEEKINFLIDNFILVKEGSNVYVHDYLTEEIDETMVSHILLKMRQYIVDLYSTQLPLRPFERDICISRQTMRREIEYHKLFLPKKPRNFEIPTADINYLSYAKVFEGPKEKEEEIKTQEEQSQNVQKVASGIDLSQRKNVNLNLNVLPFKKQQAIQTKQKDESEKLSLQDLVKLIKKAELSYQYLNVIDLCNQALLHNKDKDFQTILPSVYKKMAYAYKKNADYENSLKYYQLSKDIYDKSSDFVKSVYVKFYMAGIYYETYNIEKSKELLLEIINSEEVPQILIVKSYLQLISIAEGLSNTQDAFEYCQKAIENSKQITDDDILTELYFKYALMLDDKGDSKSAIEFYEKCIDANDDYKTNKFLSSSYSNIAVLYLEKNEVEKAVENYQKAYEIDKRSNNLEGIYFAASKLATILQRRKPDDAVKYLETALDAANQIKDNFYIVSASLAIGDFYYDKNQNELALKHYLFAYNLAQNKFSKDNIKKINVRINDIKFRIGVERFDKLVDIINEQQDQ